MGSGEPGGADGQPARPDTHTARRLVRAATGERALTSVADTTRPAIACAAKLGAQDLPGVARAWSLSFAAPARYLRWYGATLGRRRKPMEPERRLPGLEKWAGLWVAVKDGEVIAAAPTSRELVPMLVKMGSAGRGAVAQYVPHRSDIIQIGVG